MRVRLLATLALILVLVLVLVCAGCYPGQEGWSCDSDGDCRGGRVCKDTSKGSLCLEPGQYSFRGRTTGWFTFIGGIALLAGVPLLMGIAVLIKRRKDRREAAIEAARPRVPRPAGPAPVCPRCDGMAQKMGLPQPVPDWQELSGRWYCRVCRAPF